jgi:hypothetical protein
MAKKKSMTKVGIILAIVIVIFGGLYYAGYRFYKYMVPNEVGEPLYLERIEGLPEINDNLFINVQNTLNDFDIVKSAEVTTQGPIIYNEVVVNDEATIEEVELIFENYFDSYSGLILEEYDFQFIILKDNEVVGEDEKLYFPHFGSKSKQEADNNITWTVRYEYLDTITVEEEIVEETEEESAND